ncbi:pilus assembly protein [Delftia tsuruhatensis]|uniref:PilC/PilY family type IV pilus protein n=1 Tax=Delftia tsuruhatensis TaxID=180282 RepID=A0AAX3SIG3_9BURK|nr:PilC/PilY family type IV pilus protein [Delftia tsuruhatensis]WFF79813.1 PilC/PilY family type IV pilus protein [Delftia tsuruhatensis]
MKKPSFQQRTLACAVLSAFAGTQAISAEIPFAQYPAGSAHKMPIPNVVLSVDDSGSMAWNDDGGSASSSKPARITSLKIGLKNVLVNTSKYDNQFRLAWQSMWRCNNIPSNQSGCDGNNAMANFSGAHKDNFSAWVDSISAKDGTPSHTMMWNAGQYMKTTGVDSPWNATPGVADTKPISCRRAYHVFMTDGGWNTYLPSTNFDSFDFQTKMVSSHAEAIGNSDGTTKSLPTPEAPKYGPTLTYDITSDQTKIYRDNYGSGTKKQRVNKKDYYFAYPTLADMAFHYWSTDLQPTIKNEIPFEPKKSTDETFKSGISSVTIKPEWNPKNDPATWQHLVTHTIGYGARASNWDDTNKNPIFTNGMYGDGFTDAILGIKKWTDATDDDYDGNYTSGIRKGQAITDYVRPEELWHMAINSRGKFFPVQTGADLEKAFDEIFSSIVADNTSPLTGFTSASNSISRNNTESFQSGYVAAEDLNSNKNRWSGFVASEKIISVVDPQNSQNITWKTTPNPAWGLNPNKTAPNNHMTTADKLDALSATDITSRLILSHNGSTGISFEWGTTTQLSTTQQALLNLTPSDGRGKDRVNYIRGDRSKEENQTGGVFRQRKSRQADIVNSSIWYAGPPSLTYNIASYTRYIATHSKRIPMLYVGGNDGMLHGFSAIDGSEKIAYVPQGVIKNLPDFSSTGYTHRYYVDGSPFTGDLNLGTKDSPNWATYLVGTLGAGGKGYFVLNTTKPGTTDGVIATDFSKANASSLVIMDKTDGSDADIGHIFGAPVVEEANPQRALQITKTNDGRWAVIMGNGYNSTNERPVLLIQYLDENRELKKISAVPVTTPKNAEADQNGLSTPQFLDINSDGVPDIVYAGDLRGNLWKFDISSNNASNWNVAFDGRPLFTATYSTGVTGSATSRQPITTPPVLRPNRQVGGLMVAFGTGRSLTEGDRTDTDSKQTVYSIIDNTRYTISKDATSKGKVVLETSDPTPATVSRTQLMSQAIEGAKKPGEGASSNRDFWAVSNNSAIYDCQGKSNCTAVKGWYFDLPEAGERVLNAIEFYDGSNVLEIMSEVPASGGATTGTEESCEPTPKSAKPFRTLLTIEQGSKPRTQILDLNGDGLYNGEDKSVNRMTSDPKELRFSNKSLQVRKGNSGREDKLSKIPELMLRPNWRQLN